MMGEMSIHKPDGTHLVIKRNGDVHIDATTRAIYRCQCGAWRYRGKQCTSCAMDDLRG